MCAFFERWKLCLVVFVLSFFLQGALSLKDVRLLVPIAVERGKVATLMCHYDLDGELLYVLKWYKGQREFFRFAPKSNPPIKQFPLPGLHVLETMSNNSHLVLANVSMETSGNFSCEVTAEAPSFSSITKSGVLQVVEIPRHDPIIKGLKPRYRLGDTLTANCTSKESHPAANLTWFVNDLPVEPERIKRHRPHQSDISHLVRMQGTFRSGTTRHFPSRNRRHKSHENDVLVLTENKKHKFHHNDNNNEGFELMDARSHLRLPIKKDLFKNGRLKIRCSASLHDVYYKSSEKSVDLEKNRSRPHYVYYTTSTQQTTIQYEPPLAAERYPHTTLIFGTSASARLDLSYSQLVALAVWLLVR